jgi:superfamily I DNA and/or RNA helicase
MNSQISKIAEAAQMMEPMTLAPVTNVVERLLIG